MKGALCALGLLVLLVTSGCDHHHEEKKEPEPISITRWTDKTELFVEFAPLLVGKETSFAAHLTDLDTFKPVSEGTLKVSFAPPQGKEIVFEAASSDRCRHLSSGRQDRPARLLPSGVSPLPSGLRRNLRHD